MVHFFMHHPVYSGQEQVVVYHRFDGLDSRRMFSYIAVAAISETQPDKSVDNTICKLHASN